MDLLRKITRRIILSTYNQSWFVFLAPCLIFSIFGFKDLGLPGLYMDSVNPDYMAVWIQRQSLSIPAWIYPDNWLAGMHKFPLLNSLYGGNSTAYLAMLFFKLFGFGAIEVHLFHSLIGVLLLLSLVWCLLKWRTPKFSVVLFGCLLASDPSYIFAWRTQYYLQLYPLIWLFLGLGLLGGIFFDGKNDSKRQKQLKTLLAGAFIGFSAYSYFIFVIYMGSIAIIFFLATKRDGLKPFFYLIAGTLIGFSPYVYAHISIVLHTDFSSYVMQLKGLQAAYGVVDSNQGGLIERLGTVNARLEELVFGRGVEKTIFGTAGSPFFSPAIVFGSLSLILFIFQPYFIFLHKISDKNLEQERSNRLSLLIISVLVGFFIHLIFGMIIGKPLGIQHFIMALPLFYFICAISFSQITFIKNNNLIKIRFRIIALTLAIFILIINILSGHRISNRLQMEGGNGLYSDAINTIGLYIKDLPAQTVLLFPQWGYWMGVIMITGPIHSVFQTSNLEEMESRIKSDPELKNRNSFVLVIGRDYFRGDDLHVNLVDLQERNGLILKDIVVIHGRNNIDKIKLVHMLRREL